MFVTASITIPSAGAEPSQLVRTESGKVRCDILKENVACQYLPGFPQAPVCDDTGPYHCDIANLTPSGAFSWSHRQHPRCPPAGRRRRSATARRITSWVDAAAGREWHASDQGRHRSRHVRVRRRRAPALTDRPNPRAATTPGAPPVNRLLAPLLGAPVHRGVTVVRLAEGGRSSLRGQSRGSGSGRRGQVTPALPIADWSPVGVVRRAPKHRRQLQPLRHAIHRN